MVGSTLRSDRCRENGLADPIGPATVITIELNKNLGSWFDPNEGKQPDRRAGLAHYHGDF